MSARRQPQTANGPNQETNMLDENGNYDFAKHQFREYQHDYSYLGGFLGADEVADKKKKQALQGKVDLLPRLPPKDATLRAMVEKFAARVISQEDPEFCEHSFFTRDPQTYFFLREKDGTSRKFEADKKTGRVKDPKEKSAAAAREEAAKSNPFHTSVEEEQEKARDYYQFVKHCSLRGVDFMPLVAKQQMVEADRIAKLADENPDAPEKKFLPGVRVEVIGLKAKPEYNGEFASVKSFVKESGRFQVVFEKYGTEIAVKPVNMVMAQRQEKPEEEWKHEIPKHARVIVQGLTSEGGKLLNGLKGEVVSYDDEKGRYNVKLDAQPGNVKKVVNLAVCQSTAPLSAGKDTSDCNSTDFSSTTTIQVKQENLKCDLPPGWTEHWDEHMQKFFYRNTKTSRIQWKHPILKARVITTDKQKMAGGTFDLNEAAEEADFARQRYQTDDLNEGEGGFSLKDLVAKVQREEERKRRRDAGEEIDSDEEEEKAEQKWMQERGLLERARKRTKKERQQLFKHHFLVQNIQDFKKKLGLDRLEDLHNVAYYTKKVDAQAVLEARKDALQELLDARAADKKDRDISAGKFGAAKSSSADAAADEDDDGPVIVLKKQIPEYLWRDCEIAVINGIELIHNEFTDARQKHTVQQLNLTIISLMDDAYITGNQFAEKMESLLGLMKCI
eukprot:g13407.t1